MKERPILMQGPMVRAILDGRKTQTRRIIKPQPVFDGYWWSHGDFSVNGEKGFLEGMPIFGGCPYGKVGDRLWVRESFCELRREHWGDPSKPKELLDLLNRRNGCAYSADTVPGSEGDDFRKEYGYKWTPCIHMPRWASRLALEITDVRVERLQDISNDDCRAEGCCHRGWDVTDWKHPHNENGWDIERANFASLWQSINGLGSWDQNPFVWVITFRRIES